MLRIVSKRKEESIYYYSVTPKLAYSKFLLVICVFLFLFVGFDININSEISLMVIQPVINNY